MGTAAYKASAVNNSDAEQKSCWICDSLDHFKAGCPVYKERKEEKKRRYHHKHAALSCLDTADGCVAL